MAAYLVTGGCGFIGSHLADALAERGDTVRILDDLSTGSRENAPRMAQVIIGDVADPDVVAGALSGMDGCFHLAAISSVARSNEEWLATHRTNLDGMINVLEAARQTREGGIPVVYASSAAIYGDAPERPLHESVAARPLTAYGADKLGCELHARVGAAVHGMSTVGLRLFNIYGPRQNPASPYAGVISLFVDRLRAGHAVTVFGDGEQTRDFVFVADAVRFFLAAMGQATAGAAAMSAGCPCESRTGRNGLATSVLRSANPAPRRRL